MKSKNAYVPNANIDQTLSYTGITVKMKWSDTNSSLMLYFVD